MMTLILDVEKSTKWMMTFHICLMPLFAIVLDFFDIVEEKLDEWAMDNIYNLGAFSKAEYNHEKNY